MIRLAILDQNENYLKRMQSYFQMKYSETVEMFLFTDQEKALAVVNKVDVFLVDENIEIDVEALPKKCAFAYLSGENVEQVKGKKAVARFQSLDQLYLAVLNLYGDLDKAGIVGNASCKTVAVTSFSGGTGVSTIAAALAYSKASAGYRTLLLSFETLGQAETFFHFDGRYNLTNAIMAIRKNTGNLTAKLLSYVSNSVEGVSSLLGTRLALDMRSLSDSDMQLIIRSFQESGQFDYIIVDIPMLLTNDRIQVFGKADQLLIITDGSEMSRIKLNRGLEALNMAGTQNVKIQEIVDQLLDRAILLVNRTFTKEDIQSDDYSFEVVGSLALYQSSSVYELVHLLAGLMRDFRGI